MTIASRMTLPGTSLEVSDLCFGANVFGWSIHDQDQANELLDHLVEHGVNFFDSADMYVQWHPGNHGGESEKMLGAWLKGSNLSRDKVVIATKVGKMTTRPGLSPDNIRLAVTESLQRLGTDYIDLYYAHFDDQTVSLEDTLGALGQLVDEGLVRYIGASNYSLDRLIEAQETANRLGVPGYVAVQNHYNLVFRDEYESGVANYVDSHQLAGLPYFSLASGFLAGRYNRDDQPDSPRVDRVTDTYFSAKNFDTLDRLREVAHSHSVEVASVALEWLRQQTGVSAPIASASRIEQVEGLLRRVELSDDEMTFLSTPAH